MYKKRKENTISKQLLIGYVLLFITLCSFLSCPDVDCPDAINNLFG